MTALPHPVTHLRRTFGWSQEDLAKRAGVARSSVSAIEGRRFIPSVTTAVRIARALGCTVEDLFADLPISSQEAPRWAWRASHAGGRYWEAEVGGRVWLYPAECARDCPVPHDGVWAAGAGGAVRNDRAWLTLMIASCDPSAYLLAAEYARTSGYRMIVLPRSGAAAMELLRAGLVHAAAVHRSTATRPDGNAQFAREVLGSGFRIVRAAHWVEGLATPPSVKGRSVRKVAYQTRHWALREPGAAARECLEELCEGAPVSGRVVTSHRAVAEAVRAGWAEAGICVQLAAQEAGLRFLPVRTEALDLCYRECHEGDRRIQALLRVLRSVEYQRLLQELPGYRTDETGEIVYHA
jgi:molybdate-binding protein/DNA-binding XRE family transcriptional regulator